MALAGLLGGLVRVCGSLTPHTWKEVSAAMATSFFSGGVAAAAFHELIPDPVYLGAVCSMFGYIGQVGIGMLLQWVTRITGLTLAEEVVKKAENIHDEDQSP